MKFLPTGTAKFFLLKMELFATFTFDPEPLQLNLYVKVGTHGALALRLTIE
jgi:hypothetical protein